MDIHFFGKCCRQQTPPFDRSRWIEFIRIAILSGIDMDHAIADLAMGAFGKHIEYEFRSFIEENENRYWRRDEDGFLCLDGARDW
jgi:hypothetical protein